MLKKNIKKLFRSSGKFFPNFPGQLVIKKYSRNNHHIFFGYYDRSPFSKDDNKVLACIVPKKWGKNQSIPMQLGYFDLNDPTNHFNKFAETTTWCWQMGCRLRWVHTDSEENIFFNYYNNRYSSKIIEPNNGKVLKRYDYPFYDINDDASLGVSINFSRLQRLRPGYGYNNLKDSTKGELIPGNEYLSLFNLKNNEILTKISLEEISKINSSETMKNAEHYFNHISISPDSSKFIFFHLWTNKKNKFSRLFSYDLNEDKIKLITEQVVSHYAWKNSDEILITEYNNGKLLYCLYNLFNSKKIIIGENILNKDGHPSFIDDCNIITDTYPNIFGHQSLLFYSLSKPNKLITVKKVYSPIEFSGEKKCDLHPRLSNNKKMINIDIAEKNKREMLIIDINKLNIS